MLFSILVFFFLDGGGAGGEGWDRLIGPTWNSCNCKVMKWDLVQCVCVCVIIAMSVCFCV